MADFFLHPEKIGGSYYIAPIDVPTAGDTTGPVMQGAISYTKTSTTTDIAWPAATDAVGVAEYFVAKDGAAAVSTGLTRAASFAGLAPQSSHQYVITARDAAGNLSSNSLTLTVVTDADLPPVMPDTLLSYCSVTTMRSEDVIRVGSFL